MKTIPHWINGQYYEGSPTGCFEVENPGTGDIEAELLQASDADLDHAVDVARRAQKEWARVPLAKRTAIMFRMRQLVLDHQDEMARMIVAEHGKNYSDAVGEIQRGRETLDFATAINAALKGEYSFDVSTGVDIHTLRQPVGVVAGICPFNFPAMVPMWMHPLAIATGNAFILKPASATPSAALLTAELYKKAGLPDGVFNVVSGNRTMVSKVLEHPGIDAISFVGSTPVAHIVQNTGITHGKRVQALGGANNHAIVMPDSDLDFAAQHISAASRCRRRRLRSGSGPPRQGPRREDQGRLRHGRGRRDGAGHRRQVQEVHRRSHRRRRGQGRRDRPRWSPAGHPRP